MPQRTKLLISLSLALTAFLCSGSASAEALDPNSLTGNWERSSVFVPDVHLQPPGKRVELDPGRPN